MDDNSIGKIRVLVFGATGIGKTSLCNTLTGRTRPTDNGARGVTAKSHLYAPFQIENYKIELVDTVGLHESIHGTIPAEQAVVELVELLEKARSGFNLLVHVARASRITKEHDDDYKFFVEKMTKGSIPVVLAITGCENDDPMNSWVERNQTAFNRFSYKEIVPTCFASGGPLEDFFEPLRSESRASLLKSIVQNALEEPVKLYGDEVGDSFSEALTRIWNDFISIAGLPDKYRRKVNESAYALMKRLGVPKALADATVQHIPDLLEELGDRLPMPFGGKILRKFSEIFIDRFSNKKVKDE